MPSIREPFKQGTPPPGYTDTEVIRLTRGGSWIADDREISHEPTCKLFFRSIRRDETGYFLKIGKEYKRIEVEDTAFFVIRIDGAPDAGYELTLSDQTKERLESPTLTYRQGRLACRIKEGEEEARFLSQAYYELLEELREDASWYYLEIGGKRVNLARSGPA